MAERKDRLEEIGVTVVGVGTREDFQAQRLMDDWVPFELLLDPDDRLRRSLDIADRFEWRRLLHPRGAVDYVRAWRRAGDFDPIWAEANQRPAMVLFDARGRVSWTHVGSRIGDYPIIDEVMEAVERLP